MAMILKAKNRPLMSTVITDLQKSRLVGSRRVFLEYGSGLLDDRLK